MEACLLVTLVADIAPPQHRVFEFSGIEEFNLIVLLLVCCWFCLVFGFLRFLYSGLGPAVLLLPLLYFVLVL
ncbi:hypothetical protein P8452_48948 [Trifolium repens]|nr:hypothetical protein P8452_48948 [Trifolium repens]